MGLNTAISRTVQIDIILDNTNELIEWFDQLWDGMMVKEINAFHFDGGEYIYYKLGENNRENVLFFRDDKNLKFWYKENPICYDLGCDFGLYNDEIMSVLKVLIDNKLKSDIGYSSYTTLFYSTTTKMHTKYGQSQYCQKC